MSFGSPPRNAQFAAFKVRFRKSHVFPKLRTVALEKPRTAAMLKNWRFFGLKGVLVEP